MVHFRSTATFLAMSFGLVDLALGAGATPALKVLTGTAPKSCTPQQVAALKQSVDDSITLAEVASTALKAPNAGASSSFTSYLGNADPKKMDAQHYTPVTELRGVPLQSVTVDQCARAPDKETWFLCLPFSDPLCSQGGKATGYAAGGFECGVAICPLFFEKPHVSLDESKAKILAGQANGLVMGGRDILHEFQHVSTVVGDHWVQDLHVQASNHKIVVPMANGVHRDRKDVEVVYHTELCKGLPADKKCLNAQNIATYALDVYAHAPPLSKPKTKRRFEEIYQRRVEKV